MTARRQRGAFVRFLVVGGSFSVLFAILTAGLIRFAGTPPLPTSVGVYVLCIPLAFWAQKSFAFRSEKTGRPALLLYAATQFASLSLVSAVASRFTTRVFVYDTALYLAVSAVAAVASFLICRFVIFKAVSS